MTAVRWEDTLPPTPGQVAGACIARGWRVIPLWSGTRTPVFHGAGSCPRRGVCRDGHIGWPDLASTDPEQIEKWFSHDFPDSRVGIVTGPESGIFVVDVDVKRGNGFAEMREIFAAHGEERIPASFRVRTKSRGMHLYGVWPENVDRMRGKLSPNVDLKGWHGYVVAPDEVCYHVLDDSPLWVPPPWFVELVTRPPEMPLSHSLPTGWADPEVLTRSVALRLSQTVHNRNTALFGAAKDLAKVSQYVGISKDYALAALLEACEVNGLLADPADGEAKCRSSFESGWRSGLEATTT